MPATTPEQVSEQLIDALSRGDIDTAIALYEPEASFVGDGKVVSGTASIRSCWRPSRRSSRASG